MRRSLFACLFITRLLAMLALLSFVVLIGMSQVRFSTKNISLAVPRGSTQQLVISTAIQRPQAIGVWLRNHTAQTNRHLATLRLPHLTPPVASSRGQRPLNSASIWRWLRKPYLVEVIDTLQRFTVDS